MYFPAAHFSHRDTVWEMSREEICTLQIWDDAVSRDDAVSWMTLDHGYST